MTSRSEQHELSEVLEQLVENTNGEKISLGDLLKALDSRSFGPLLLLIGIVAISPIGGIPGMSIVTGTLIVLLGVQMLAGRSHPWFPESLLSIEFGRERLTHTVDQGKPWVKWVEKILHHRLSVLTQGTALYGVAAASILLAVSFYPLAFIPAAVFLPGLAVTLLALGVTARDGLPVILGYLITVVAYGTLVIFWPF